jgi:hypothetical protein
MSRKTTAYARKIRRTGPGFNGAAWLNTLERVRSYTSEPIFHGIEAADTMSAAVKSALVVREAFEDLRTGAAARDDGRAWDIMAHAVDVATIRCIEIAGNDPDKNPMLPIMLAANAALKRIRERRDRTGSWGLGWSGAYRVAGGAGSVPGNPDEQFASPDGEGRTGPVGCHRRQAFKNHCAAG